MFGSKRSRDMSKYFPFHEDYEHDTNDCRYLRIQIQEVVNSGQLSHLHPYYGGKDITSRPVEKVNNAPVIIEAKIFGRKVGRVYMDSRSSLPLEITIGNAPLSRIENLNFVVVRTDSLHNMLLGRTAMQMMGIVVLTIYEAIKFHTEKGIGIVFSTNKVDEGAKRARRIPITNEERILNCVNAEEKIIVNDKYPDQMVTIGKQLPNHFKKELQNLLKSNVDVFAWIYADMTGISRIIMVEGKPFNTEHKLNEYNHIKPIKQSKRGLGPDRNIVAYKEIEELTKAEILRRVKYQTWVANPVMVKKSDGG
ncbi:hypothetical protein Tco_1464216 [Tanacetum coccineum]